MWDGAPLERLRFSPDGREYIIHSDDQQITPLPWVNVLSNPLFGTVISESGQSYTWFENAHEFRISPWNNDPVTDSGGEVYYLRDEMSGRFWSPSSLPCPGKSGYTVRHGFGYSRFEHEEDGITSEMQVYVDVIDPVKFTVLKIRNMSGRQRRISITGTPFVQSPCQVTRTVFPCLCKCTSTSP